MGVVPGAEVEAEADVWAVEGQALWSSAVKAASRPDGEGLSMTLSQGAEGGRGRGRKGR